MTEKNNVQIPVPPKWKSIVNIKVNVTTLDSDLSETLQNTPSVIIVLMGCEMCKLK